MSDFDFDLFVIGGGSGGVRASRVAAAHGARVVEAVMSASGPRGFRYSFVKLYGVARRPG